MLKPTLFVGSSSEGLATLRVLIDKEYGADTPCVKIDNMEYLKSV